MLDDQGELDSRESFGKSFVGLKKRRLVSQTAEF